MTATNESLIDDLYDSVGVDRHAACAGEDVAHLEIHHNKVLGAHLVPGLGADVKELDDGIEAKIWVEKNAVIAKPVQVCFGMLPETGLQRIVLDINIGDGGQVALLAYCTFPNAKDVRHEMDAVITVGEGASYTYFERHVHGDGGGVTVVPDARVIVKDDARFKTEFELIKGRCGKIDLSIDAECGARSVVDMLARISGRGDDEIKINEKGHLAGEYARGALVTHIAVRDDASAHVDNTLRATAPYARGHVDCKEIVQGNATATAVPVVQVLNPKAHVTHEAAIGSVDTKQLETLMARGLDEDAATDLIIEGLLS